MTRKVRPSSRHKKEKINATVFLVGGLLLIIAFVLLMFKNSADETLKPAVVGQPLGDFSLTEINGKTVSLSDYAGQVVLINAWATWCPPCKAEMPDLNAYYQAHQDEGFVLLAVNAGDSADDAASFANQKGLTFPVLLDPNTSLLTSLGVNSFPTSILVGADGVVKAIHIGIFTPEALENEITPYLRDAQ